MRRCWLIIGLLASLAAADEVELKNGGRIEGKILRLTARHVVIRTRLGVQRISREAVRRIVYKETPAEELGRRLKATDPKDVKALLALARWAHRHGLHREARDLYRRVLRVAPENEAAHRALGHVRYKGEWLTPKAAAARRRAEEEAAMRARGLVPYRGEWVTPEEREAREKGWVRVGDRWLPPAEANALRGLVYVDGAWVAKEEAAARRRAAARARLLGARLGAKGTRHFVVLSAFGAEHARKIAQRAEEALATVRTQVGYRRALWPAETPMEILLFKDFAPYAKLVDAVAAETGQARGWAAYTKHHPSFHVLQPPMSVDWLGGRKQGDLTFAVVHKVGHVALAYMYFAYNYLPPWLDEGFAAWLEIAVLGESLTTCSTVGYDVLPVRGDKGSRSATWRAQLREAAGRGTAPPLNRLFLLRLNRLGYLEIAKSWSLVDWWLRTKREAFHRFLQALRRRYPRCDQYDAWSPNELRRLQQEALREAFGLEPEAMDAAWRRYVLAGN